MGSFMGREHQYIQLVKVLYCKLLIIGEKLPSFPHRFRVMNRRSQRWEASVTIVPPWPHLRYVRPALVTIALITSFLKNKGECIIKGHCSRFTGFQFNKKLLEDAPVHSGKIP